MKNISFLKLSWITSVLGLKSLTSGKFKSFLQLSGIFSIYLIESYEKNPEIKEQIFGKFFGVSNLKSSIIFSIKVSGLSFNLIFLFFLIM